MTSFLTMFRGGGGAAVKGVQKGKVTSKKAAAQQRAFEKGNKSLAKANKPAAGKKTASTKKK